MKKVITAIFLSAVLAGCATGGGLSSSQNGSSSVSAEAQAKNLTSRMKTTLSLDKNQEDRVLQINVVNQKLLQRLRQNNEESLISSAKENYHKELKGVLTSDQFTRFRSSFPDL